MLHCWSRRKDVTGCAPVPLSLLAASNPDPRASQRHLTPPPGVSALKTHAGQKTMFRYLDRPVFQAERVAAAAWTVGGAEAEREARTRQAERKEGAFSGCFCLP